MRQNLVLHARLFQVPETEIPARVEEMVQRFGLAEAVDAMPGTLPLGIRQRLSLAVAMVHRPELLILLAVAAHGILRTLIAEGAATATGRAEPDAR